MSNHVTGKKAPDQGRKGRAGRAVRVLSAVMEKQGKAGKHVHFTLSRATPRNPPLTIPPAVHGFGPFRRGASDPFRLRAAESIPRCSAVFGWKGIYMCGKENRSRMPPPPPAAQSSDPKGR